MANIPLHATTPDSTAIVLGGGGIAGISWELGVLDGLITAGVQLETPDMVLGTSAGSVVGALLRNGAIQHASHELLQTQLPAYEAPAGGDPDAVAQAVMSTLDAATDDRDARARIGAEAQRVSGGQSEDARAALFSAILGTDQWPTQPFGVTTVDASDGSFRVFDGSDGVPIARALAASCCVPFVWKPVTIDGRPFVDGGVRSRTNADALAGYAKILVLACRPEEEAPTGPHLDRAVTDLRAAGASVEVIMANDAYRAVADTDSLALTTREPAAAIGRAQAAEVARRIRSFWQ